MSDTLLGVIIGGFLTTAAAIITEYFRGRRESGLDQAKRADDRRLAHDTFQRETLLRLQEALVEWARVQAELHAADLRVFRESGRWGKATTSEDAGAREMLANRTLTMLRSRIDDETLREEIGAAQRIAFQMILTKSVVEAEDLNNQLAHAMSTALSHAGELVRKLW